jgi:hypothetical protein
MIQTADGKAGALGQILYDADSSDQDEEDQEIYSSHSSGSELPGGADVEKSVSGRCTQHRVGLYVVLWQFFMSC